MNIPIAPSTIGRKYGFRRAPLPNFSMRPVFRAASDAVFPPKTDLLELQPPPFDQGQEGSCTANSACGEARYLHRLLGIAPDADFARQLLYYLERKDQGSAPDDDSGSSIAESVAAMETYGLALESDWPYDGNFSTTPTDAILAEAAQHKILAAQIVANDPASFKQCIADNRGIMIGFTVFESFENPQFAKDGIMPMPADGENILGGHAVRIIGYDDTMQANGLTGYYLVRNSWGEGWALQGNFWMPYDFVHGQQYATDFHRLDQAA